MIDNMKKEKRILSTAVPFSSENDGADWQEEKGWRGLDGGNAEGEGDHGQDCADGEGGGGDPCAARREAEEDWQHPL